jgi:hypothetical protein
MTKVFLPSFSRARRRRRRVPEAVAVTTPEIKPPEWEGRKKELCMLALYGDKNGQPLCLEKFFPTTGNQLTCSPKCGRKLRKIRHAPIAARWAKNNPKKVSASSVASMRRRLANSPELRAKVKAYVKANRKRIYNPAQQRYVDKNRDEVNRRKRDNRAVKRMTVCVCGCGCKTKFRLRQGPPGPLSNLCSKCRIDPRCFAATLGEAAAKTAWIDDRHWRKKQKAKQSAKG